MASLTYQVGNAKEGCGHTHKTTAAALTCLQSYQDAGAPKTYKIWELNGDGAYHPIATPVVRKASANRLGPVVIQPKPIAAAIVVESQYLATLPQPKAAKPERKLPLGKKVQARDVSHLPPVPLHRTPVADGGLAGNPADRPVTVDLAHVRLLEDPRNGIILLQVEKPTATGSVCVYNNGKRVAAGEVAPETIANLLRPVPNAPNIQEAAYQLLNPIVSSVEVTPLAARHLTAVLEASRNEIPMAVKSEATPVAKSKKFAAPVVKAAKAKAKVDPNPPEKKVAKNVATSAPDTKKVAKPVKIEAAEPKASRGAKYALIGKDAETALAEYRSPQVAFIVAKLKSAGKAGLTKAELTEAAIKAGATEFPTNQPHDRAIGFYLSKFKGLGHLQNA
jgi:hypothetical protein